MCLAATDTIKLPGLCITEVDMVYDMRLVFEDNEWGLADWTNDPLCFRDN